MKTDQARLPVCYAMVSDGRMIVRIIPEILGTGASSVVALSIQKTVVVCRCRSYKTLNIDKFDWRHYTVSDSCFCFSGFFSSGRKFDRCKDTFVRGEDVFGRRKDTSEN